MTCFFLILCQAKFDSMSPTPQEFDFEYNDSRQTANSCSRGNEKIQITESFWSAVEKT